MRQSQDLKRRTGLINENDGLDCFATESVADVQQAHADRALAEFEEVLPAVRVASVPPERRRPTRHAVVVDTPEVLPPARIVPPPAWRLSWPGTRVAVVALVFLVVGLVGMWMNIQRGRPQTTTVASPPSVAPARPAAPGAPSTEVAPSIAEAAPVTSPERVATPSRAETETPSPTSAPTPRVVAVVPEVSRRAANAPPAGPEVPVAAQPDPPAPVENAPAVAENRPVAVAPEFVRAEPPAEVAEARAPIVTPPNDRASIERVLEQYREAYDNLDAPSAAVIWPRVDTRALSRAFSTLASQDLSFDRCDLAITGVKANAQCTGAIRYVRRVGDQEPRVRRMSWSFAFERVSDRWQIAQVTAD